MPRERELLARVEHWLAARAEPPTLFDVIETGDRELVAAFILKGFRAAARKAVVERLNQEAAITFASELSNAAAALLRVFDGIADSWSLEDGDKLALLGLTTQSELQVLRAAPLQELPTEIIERVAIVLDIFKAINTLLPRPGRADAWIRSPNSAPMFSGQSALEFMVGGGLRGMREVRLYLNAEIWST